MGESQRGKAMTLDQLWTKVNSNYRTVKTLSNKVSLDAWDKISGYNTVLEMQIDWIRTHAGWTTKDIVKVINVALGQISMAQEFGFKHLDTKIDQASYNMEKLFHTNMSNVIRYIQDAVDLVMEQAGGGGSDFREYVDNAISGMQNQLAAEINALEGVIDSDIANVKILITTKYEQVKSWVNETFSDAWNWLEDGLSDLWGKTKTYADELFTDAKAAITELYDDMEDAIIAVRTSIVNYYGQLKGYVEEIFEKAKEYVNIAVRNIERSIDRIHKETKRWVLDRLDKIVAGVKAAVDIVQDAIDQLTILSDWRFSFFDWFVVRPELSMLSVLTRSDATFEHYKPYWQAFFARTLEEA